MECPDTWVIGKDSNHNVHISRNCDGIPPHGVLEIPRRGGALVSTVTPADYLEILPLI